MPKQKRNAFSGLLPRRKPFLCYGGTIVSKNNGDVHYISAYQIARLYRVRISDCVLLNENSPLAGIYDKGRVILIPRCDGKYSLTERIKEQQERINNDFSDTSNGDSS